MGHSIRLMLFVAFSALSAGAIHLRAAEPDTANLPADRTDASALRSALAALDKGDIEPARLLLADRAASLEKAERHFLQGRIQYLKQRLSSARRSLQAAIKLRPRRADYHYWLGRTYEADRMFTLAASSLQRAYTFGMDGCELHYHWALVLDATDTLLGEVRQQAWGERYPKAPKTGEFAFDGIVARHVRGRPEVVIIAPKRSALFQIQKALAADPKRADVRLTSGTLWAKVDEHVRAIQMFKAAAESLKGADLAACHDKWAASCLALGRLNGFLEHTIEYMKLTGGVDVAKLAQCYEIAAREASALGQLPRQIRYLTLAAESHATPARLIKLADALLTAQRADDAERYLSQALEQKPTRTERAQIKQRLARTTYLTAPSDSR